MALKTHLSSVTSRIVIDNDGLNWEKISSLCGIWEATGIIEKLKYNCFAIKNYLQFRNLKDPKIT